MERDTGGQREHVLQVLVLVVVAVCPNRLVRTLGMLGMRGTPGNGSRLSREYRSPLCWALCLGVRAVVHHLRFLLSVLSMMQSLKSWCSVARWLGARWLAVVVCGSSVSSSFFVNYPCSLARICVSSTTCLSLMKPHLVYNSSF